MRNRYKETVENSNKETGDTMRFFIRWIIYSSIICCLLASMTVYAFGHAGMTDENGGHTDSETGEYHYHHGYPAHSHYDVNHDGKIDCPYEFDDKTGQNSGQSNNDSSGGAHHRNPTSATVPTTKPNSIPADSQTDNASISSPKDTALHNSRTISNKRKLDFYDYIISWQYFAIALFGATIAVSFAYLSSLISKKGHRFISKLFLGMSVVFGVISIPGILLIAMFIYITWSVIALIWYLLESIFKWISSSILTILRKKSQNNSIIIKRIDTTEVIDPPANSSKPAVAFPSSIAYSNGNRAYDICKFMWIRSNIFGKQLSTSPSMQARTYLWTAFFYVITKSIRKQTIVDEIYAELIPSVDYIMEKIDRETYSLTDIESDYRNLWGVLESSQIDPRTIDGIDELWNLVAPLAFPDCQLADNALFGFRYNTNLLTNHVLIRYQLKKTETIYYFEARNGMTIRVPESKIQPWTEAQASNTPRISEEEQGALAGRIAQKINHPNSE